MTVATLNGTAVMRLELVIPFSRIWHADATLTSDVDVGVTQSLVLAGVTYTCAIIRRVDFAGRLMLRLVGGKGGWRKTIDAKQYQSDLGVPTTAVVQDAASAAGELPVVIGATVPATLGSGFVRVKGAASLVLQQVFGDTWWMDPTGVVQTMPRAAAQVPGSFVVVDIHGSPGWATIATESPSEWVPGRTFSSPAASGTINRVRHMISGHKLRTHVELAA